MAKTIAIAGKGGTGKTTTAALIIRYLCEKHKGAVLAIDADPDANLGTLLGVKTGKSIGDLREDLLSDIRKLPAGMTKPQYIEAGLHQIVDEEKGFDLITMGRGEGPGCYCSLNNFIRKFSDNLAPSYSWVVMDNEAGLEHISRRTTSNIDILLIVANGSPLSFKTAKEVVRLVDNLKNKIGRKYIITNMVRDEKKEAIQKLVSELHIDYLGNIPRDPIVEDAILNGDSVFTLKDSKAKEYIFSIMDKIGGENGNT